MKKIIIAIVMGSLLGLPLSGVAADKAYNEKNKYRERAYGWEYMTDVERAQYRKRMRSFRSEREREAYRLKHRRLMEERARYKKLHKREVPMKNEKGYKGDNKPYDSDMKKGYDRYR